MIKRNTSLKEHEFVFDYEVEGKKEKATGTVTLQEPTWDQVAEAYKYLNDENGKLDLITPGKLIFDLCAFQADDEVVKNNQLMLSVCAQIAVKFVFPITAELKKN